MLKIDTAPSRIVMRLS